MLCLCTLLVGGGNHACRFVVSDDWLEMSCSFLDESVLNGVSRCALGNLRQKRLFSYHTKIGSLSSPLGDLSG